MLTFENFRWSPLHPATERRIDEVLSAWDRTPYAPGQQSRRVGVDCVQYVGAFLDTMFRASTMPGRTKTVVPRLPACVALHDPGKAMRTVAVLRKAHFGSEDETRGKTLEPGDVVITRIEQGDDAPLFGGHAMILGSVPWTAWHAIKPCVCRTTIERTRGIVAVYRPKRKDLWL